MHDKTVCYHHGGKAGRPIVHGLYSKFLKNHPDMLANYEYFKSDPKITDTQYEIALLRSLLGQFVEKHGDDEDEIGRIVGLADAIGRGVERKHKIDNGETYTVRIDDAVTIATALAETVNRHVKDANIRAAIKQDFERILRGRNSEQD